MMVYLCRDPWTLVSEVYISQKFSELKAPQIQLKFIQGEGGIYELN